MQAKPHVCVVVTLYFSIRMGLSASLWEKISYITGNYNLEIWDFSLIIPILTMVTVK